MLKISIIVAFFYMGYTQDLNLDSIALKKFVLVKQSGPRISGTLGYLKKTEFSGLDDHKLAIKVNIVDIKELYVYKNSNTITMGLLGGLVGVVTALAYNPPEGQNLGKTIPILGLTGGIIGALIGLNQENWDKVKLTNSKGN